MLSSSILSVRVVGAQVRCTIADLPLSLTPLTSIHDMNLIYPPLNGVSGTEQMIKYFVIKEMV